MAIIGNFSQTPLQGLVLANGKTPKNPTSLQFGPDGRLYISLQNGTVLAVTVEKINNTYQVIGEVEEITLVKDIPNHNDDGSLNTTEKNRQVTGLVVDQDANGNVVLYVSSSDPRIGAGTSGVDEDLDTNSGIISRLTLSDQNAPLGNDRWTKTDLVIGLPRSEENHSTNGLDIRTEDVNGVPHKIMYVAQGGHTNKGAPSSNFAFQPEYYYAGAMLRIDLTELEAIESNLLSIQSALPGGTDYVDSYVYALPTLNDPTRADVNGLDTAVGTTGSEDAEAADTFGGNNGRNQAKYDPDGPVQIYSPGYRNQYDVVITENNNIYTFDNGPNNGWGDVPLTIDGVPVDLDDADPTNDVATNNPNIDVDTGSDKDSDSLHLVTEGFYAGLPNPIRASGSAAGLFAVDTSSGTPVVTQLTANNGTPSLEDDLPEDWADISGGLTNPIEGVYKTPGDNPDGSFVGPDGSYLTIGSSSNGLTEYTADGITDSINPNTEVLIVASFNGDLTFIEVNSDGTQAGTSVTDTKAVNTGGTPLDVTAVGSQGVDGNGKFAGTVWTGLFGPDTIVILEPSTVPPMIDFDQDDDGITDELDHLQYDPNNGTATVLAGGATLFWDFNPGEEGVHPGKGTSAEGPYNIGLTGWQTNGEDDLYLDEDDPNDDQLTNLDNTIRGGAPGIIQVKEVGEGDNDLLFNDQKDAIQTGFLPAADVQDFTVIVPIFNPFSSDANTGIPWTSFASAGISLGDGSQSNFVEIAVGAKGPNDLSLKVTYEENDAVVQEIELDNVEFLLGTANGGQAIDNDQIELRLTVDIETLQLTPEWRYQLSGQWSALEQVGSSPVQLNAAGNIAQALQGQYINNSLQSSPVVSLVSSSRGTAEPFTADFLDLTIESTAKPVETADLSLSQSASDNTPNIGDTVTLTLTVDNDGPDQATGVNIQDLLPAGLSYVSDDSGGTYDPVTGLWAVDSIESGTSETLNIQTTVTSIPSATALYRVNVGGDELAPADGSSVVWEADTDSSPSSYRVGNGGAKTFTSPGGIDLASPTLPFGIPAELFESERSDPAKQPNMLWDFSVVPGSEVEVRLYFAETFSGISAAGERFFDVAVEGSVPTAFDNIDPFATAGFKGAFVVSETVTVDDGVLNLEFLHEAQRPALKGIEIVDVSGGPLSAAYENYAQVLTSDQVDPDSTPGDDSTGDDDDAILALTPNDNSKLASIETVVGGAEPDANGQFKVSLSEVAATDTVIAYSVSGSATAGSDYTALSGTVTISAGALEAFIDVAVLDDTEFDPDETVTITLDSVTSGDNDVQIGSNSAATVTLADDEAAVEVAATVNGAEPDTDAQFTLSLSNSATTDTTVAYSVSGSATAGSDYSTLSGTATILAGELTTTIDVPVLDDTEFDPDETVTITLDSVTAGDSSIQIGANNTATVTIADDDIAQANEVVIATASDGAEPNINGQFTVSLDSIAATDTVIGYTVNGTAVVGSDYTALSGTVTIPAGELSAPIDVLVLDDTDVDPDETVTVTLNNITSGDSNIAIGASDVATVTITDNEIAPATADLSLLQAVSDAAPNIGDTVTLTLTVDNAGPDSATGVSVQDLLPSGLTYVSDDSGGNYNPTTGNWTVGTVASGSSAQLTIQAEVTEVSAGDILYRINVGGNEVSDGATLIWQTDTDSSPSPNRTGTGGTKIFTVGGSIDTSSPTLPDGTPSAIFNSERSDRPKNPNMLWDFDVTPGSEVEVRLYFAETFSGITAAGQRVFDVAVEGSVPTTFNDVDPFATAGFRGGFMLSETVTVNDGVLNLEFLHEVERPALKGIEIVEVGGGLSANAYENYAQILSAAEFDPDSVAGDDSTGDDDDTTITLMPNSSGSNSNSVGSAVLAVTADSDNVKISNFGSDSFQLTNTGDKDIAQVEIDVTGAIFPDTVFDPFGSAGDSATKGLTIDTDGDTGVETPSAASYIGSGGSVGFEGLLLTFDETVNGGFNPNEMLGFSVDMDPNSVRGTDKAQLNGGTSPNWDVGGVSGAELIGASFTVTFDDGSTATGQLQGANNQAGAKGLATQASPNSSVALTVNSLTPGEVGTYNTGGPSVAINGTAGETARVVLAKGFIQPTNAYAPFLQSQLDELAATDFPANNAVELQTADILLTGSSQDISGLFDFSGIADFNFAGESEVPLGFVASIIDPNNDDLPLGPVSQPVYLQFASSLMLAGTPTQGAEALTQAELLPVVDSAIEYWAMQGASDQSLSVLASTDVVIGDLGLGVLGEADGLAIRIDDDAAGYGWSTSLHEIDPEQVDLLSVVTHEFGHVLGLTHDELGEALGVGERRMPEGDFSVDILNRSSSTELEFSAVQESTSELAYA